MSTKQKTRPAGNTSLAAFWGSVRRRFADGGFSQQRLDQIDELVNAVVDWRPSVCIEDIDPTWLGEFDQRLKASGRADRTRKTYVWAIRRVAFESAPYRFFSEKVHWRFVKPVLEAEPVGTFGRYYVAAYERRHNQGIDHKRAMRRAVKVFCAHCEAPIELETIDAALLNTFEEAQLKRGLERTHVLQRVAIIRKIVNTWRPGQIERRCGLRLVKCRKGTVEHFISTNYVNSSVKKPRQVIAGLVPRLYEFGRRREFHFHVSPTSFARNSCGGALSTATTVSR